MTLMEVTPHMWRMTPFTRVTRDTAQVTTDMAQVTLHL